MKRLLFVLFLLPTVAFAGTFQGIVFDSDASALAWVKVIEARIQYQPGWIYCDHAHPTIHLTDGRKVVVIVDSIKSYLTPEELAQVVEVDSSLIPEPAPPLP